MSHRLPIFAEVLVIYKHKSVKDAARKKAFFMDPVYLAAQFEFQKSPRPESVHPWQQRRIGTTAFFCIIHSQMSPKESFCSYTKTIRLRVQQQEALGVFYSDITLSRRIIREDLMTSHRPSVATKTNRPSSVFNVFHSQTSLVFFCLRKQFRPAVCTAKSSFGMHILSWHFISPHNSRGPQDLI